MGRQGTILVVDDNKESILKALELLLEKYFARTVIDFLSEPDSDDSARREDRSGAARHEFLGRNQQRKRRSVLAVPDQENTNPSLPVVLFTAYADIDLAVNAIKDGAADFIVKPWNNDKLISTLLSVYNLGRSKRKVKYLTEVSSRAFGFRGDVLGRVGSNAPYPQTGRESSGDRCQRVHYPGAERDRKRSDGPGKYTVARCAGTS